MTHPGVPGACGTPDSLRALTDRFDGHTSLADEENIRLHADAWEAERAQIGMLMDANCSMAEALNLLQADNAALRELLERRQKMMRSDEYTAEAWIAFDDEVDAALASQPEVKP